MHRRDPDTGGCAREEVAALVCQFRFDKTDCPAKPDNTALTDDLSGLGRRQKLHMKVYGRWKGFGIGRNENRWPHTIIEHRSEKAALHIASSIAELWLGEEGDFHSTVRRISFQNIKTEQCCARRRGKAIKSGWNGDDLLLRALDRAS